MNNKIIIMIIKRHDQKSENVCPIKTNHSQRLNVSMLEAMFKKKKVKFISSKLLLKANIL